VSLSRVELPGFFLACHQVAFTKAQRAVAAEKARGRTPHELQHVFDACYGRVLVRTIKEWIYGRGSSINGDEVYGVDADRVDLKRAQFAIGDAAHEGTTKTHRGRP
jgi:hypothetical protein